MKSIQLNIKSEAHTPQYKMHKYFARRPYNVFSELIKFYSNENQIIVDPFCGGGVTIFESLALNRKVIGFDINPLSTFITKMQVNKIDVDNLKKVFEHFIHTEENKYNYLYYINDNPDEIAEWSEFCFNVKCPKCNNIVKLTAKNKIKNGIYKCDYCNFEFKRIEGTPCGSSLIRIKTSKKIIDNPDEIKKIHFKKIPNYSNDILDVALPTDWDRVLEDCLQQKGIEKFSDFYTKRNGYINYMIFKDILLYEKKYQDYLYFLFSSSIRYTNNMSRVTENWENGNPTSMDKHAFWFPNEYIENNIFVILKKRANTLIKGYEYVKNTLPDIKFATNFSELKGSANCLIENTSSTMVNIPDKQVDMVITDPPYGSNVQYAELSSLWNIWYSNYSSLKSFIYNDEEAVVNRKSKQKDILFYCNILTNVFKEMNRILKDEGLMVFTFNNKNIKVWLAMLKAVTDAGFELNDDGICFQDYIESYKNTSHLKYSGNIIGDFIYTFKKSKKNCISISSNETISNIIDKQIRNISHNYKIINTSDLYKNIFLYCTRAIIDYLKNNNDIELLEKQFSNNFIDDVISKYYIFKDNLWIVR